jgi:hypothetical protein
MVQAIRDRIQRLDAEEIAKRDAETKRREAYSRHRAALVTALACETGQEPDALLKSEVPPRPINMLGMTEQQAKTQLMIVLDGVNRAEDPFDKDAVIRQIDGGNLRELLTPNTRKNISSFLWKLREEGIIKIKEKGQGHRQSTYVKA